MPPRCILNGLLTEAVPEELKRLDALSRQLVQRAKAFQTIEVFATSHSLELTSLHVRLVQESILPGSSTHEEIESQRAQRRGMGTTEQGQTLSSDVCIRSPWPYACI